MFMLEGSDGHCVAQAVVSMVTNWMLLCTAYWYQWSLHVFQEKDTVIHLIWQRKRKFSFDFIAEEEDETKEERIVVCVLNKLERGVRGRRPR